MQVHTGSQCHPKLVANANPVSAFSGAQCQPVLVAVAIPTLEPNASLKLVPDVLQFRDQCQPVLVPSAGPS